MKPLRAALPALMALAACGPIVQVGGNAPKPDVLYTLRAEPAAAAPAAATGRVVIVGPAAVPGELQTLRVPVIVGDTRLQYLTGAQWVEPPARLVQRLLIDRMTAAGLTALAPGPADAPDRVVGVTLRTLSLDARASGRFAAVARLDATLVDRSGRLIGSRSFEARESVADDTAPVVIEGLNRAANRAAAEIAEWTAAS
ncbi:MAG: ABC-type transport auxiliary lipoprotein family protein [Sphingomonadaceae bacterium]|nr:ABC-type transport auxiliary lipoprotein family protein [Sphingomonadaceae bacterium]